eukprot:4396642-Prymnesium_polylepis.1
MNFTQRDSSRFSGARWGLSSVRVRGTSLVRGAAGPPQNTTTACEHCRIEHSVLPVQVQVDTSHSTPLLLRQQRPIKQAPPRRVVERGPPFDGCPLLLADVVPANNSLAAQLLRPTQAHLTLSNRRAADAAARAPRLRALYLTDGSARVGGLAPALVAVELVVATLV